MIGRLIGQNTYSVNPNPVADADFLSLQTAINTVPSGSILMVHGGNYGSITLNKQLNIIGPGYFLGQNPETQATMVPAIITSATLDSAAGASFISGLTFQGIGPVSLYSSGTVLQRNAFIGVTLQLNGVSGCIFRQNYLYTVVAGPGLSTNLLFENNVVRTIGGNSLSGTFTNNIFTSHLGPNVNQHPSNSVFRNNICTDKSIGNYHPVLAANNCVLSNNIFVGMTAYNANGLNNNIYNVQDTTLFINGTGLSSDGRYALKANSPALGAGLNGVDCGIFGGPRPYVLSGIPFVPNIHFLDVPFTGTTGSGLDVHIKVNANQQ